MLGFTGDQVSALAGAGAQSALQRQVIGFSGAGGPENFAGVDVNQGGNLYPGGFNRPGRRLAERMRS